MFGHSASGPSLGGAPANDYLIDQSVFNRLGRGHDVVAVCVFFDPADVLSRMMSVDLIYLLADTQNFPSVNLDVACLPLGAAQRLVDDDSRVRERVTTPFRPSS